MAIINKIHRVTDLPELTNVDNSKILISYNKQSYIIDANLIKGKKIVRISEIKSDKSGGSNMITITFSDASSTTIRVNNGSDGAKGYTGAEGERGDTGLNAYLTEKEIESLNKNDANAVDPNNPLFTIVNDYVVMNSNDEDSSKYSTKGWSAFRGKQAYEQVKKLYEKFLTDAEYEALMHNVSYINAEFTTSKENSVSLIFNNDTSKHIVYKKYWTYEESDVATYYVAIYEVDENGNLILDENGQPNPIRYDAVVANLWDDIYLGNVSGYFEATNAQLNDVSEIYVVDPENPEEKIKKYIAANLYVYDSTKENPYVKIDVDENEKTYDEHDNEIANPTYKNKSFDYYSEGLGEYIHAEYTFTNNSWTYDLKVDDSDRFVKPIYKLDIESGEEVEDAEGNITMVYPIVKVESDEKIDESGFTKYYSAPDENSAIDSITEYLKVSTERCFVKESGKYVEQEYITKYVTDEEKAEYLASLQADKKEYILITIDRVAQTYKFDYWYPEKVKKEYIYRNVSETYSKGNIPLYSYFEMRDYFTSKIEETVDEEGNLKYETVYTKLLIPSWIRAEFTTTYEDEDALLLNSRKELGAEDNTEIDITAEDYEEYEEVETVESKFIAYGDMQKIYSKDTITELYDEVPLNEVDFSKPANFYYYVIEGYKKITAAEAISLPNNVAIYKKAAGDVYVQYDGTILAVSEYYIWNESYIAISDIASFVGQQDITIFTGIPVKLPILIMPENATERNITVDYDSDVVTLFDDGRICAINEEARSSEDNKIKTDIVLTPQTGNSLTLHITVLTPTKDVAYQFERGINVTDEKYLNEMYVGETATLKCTVRPANVSDNKVNAVELNEAGILKITQNDGPITYNTTQFAITSNAEKFGQSSIQVISNDGFYDSNSEMKNYSIETIWPLYRIDWNNVTNTYTGDTVKMTPLTYTRNDVIAWERENPGETAPFADGDFKEYRMTLLKDVPYDITPAFSYSNAKYVDLTCTRSSNQHLAITKGTKTVIDIPQVTHEATQDDIDNGYEGAIGDIIVDQQEVSHTEPQYLLTGTKITSTAGETEAGNRLYVELDAQEASTVAWSNYSYNPNKDNTNLHLHSYVIVNQSVENITVSPAAMSFNIGITKKLSVTIEPDDAIKDFTWESSNEGVATINSNGIVEGKSIGIATIYARANDGSAKYGTCSVEVTAPITDITLTSNSNVNGIIYVGIGKTTEITAQLVTNDPSNNKVNWVISNSEFASLDSSTDDTCTVRGEALGSTTLVAIAKDGSGTLGAIQIVTIKSVESISFANASQVMNVNDSLSLMPEFTPVDSTNQVLIWTSSDTSIASVNDSGIITALAIGEADIVATTVDGSDKSATCHITIE